MKIVQAGLILAPFLLLAACATTPPAPPQMAVTAITGKTCTATPSTKDAVSLMPVKPAYENIVSTLVDGSKPCLVNGETSSNYIVYALPDHGENHVITVGGVHEPLRTFAAAVSILDADGQVTRTFADDRYALFGEILGVQFRPTAEDRFVLVQSNPVLVGENVDTTETRVNTYTGYMAATPYSYGGSYTQSRGVDGKHSRTYSHEGYVQIIIQAVTGKVGLPDAK